MPTTAAPKSDPLAPPKNFVGLAGGPRRGLNDESPDPASPEADRVAAKGRPRITASDRDAAAAPAEPAEETAGDARSETVEAIDAAAPDAAENALDAADDSADFGPAEAGLQRKRISHLGSIIGASPAIKHVFHLISRVAATDASVLITGESGTGKEMVAQAVHRLGARKDRPFLAVNCGAIPAALIESELFGHEKGSFTGACRAHKGYFERASGGTLFLDEIAEMPLDLQVKLLRVLETGKILRVGGTEQVSVDVRVLAATNRPPESALRDGSLREDLYYRLAVFPIDLPPLRVRGEDAVLLAKHFLRRLCRGSGTMKVFTPAALDTLRAHEWPGNIRELKNVVHRAYILADDRIDPSCLPSVVRERSEPAGEEALTFAVGTSIQEVERRMIIATLQHFHGDKKKTADVLGICLKTLYNRLNNYDA